jgi:hypothetical protein
MFDEAVDADIAVIEAQLDELKASQTTSEEPKTRPKRAPLLPNLLRVGGHHEPEKTTCGCGCPTHKAREQIRKVASAQASVSLDEGVSPDGSEYQQPIQENEYQPRHPTYSYSQ